MGPRSIGRGVRAAGGDDGQTMKGSRFVVDVADRAGAESFHSNGPFFTAGVWQQATTTAYIKRVG